MQKQKKNKELSTEIKIWWLLNVAVFLQILMYITEQIHGTFSANNPFIHLVYNLTSIFVILPYYLVSLSVGLLLGFQGINELLIHFYQEKTVSHILMVLAVFLSLATNFLCAKLLSSKKVSWLYERYFKKYPLVSVLIIAVILYLFANG
jgi:hypothetical protein